MWCKIYYKIIKYKKSIILNLINWIMPITALIICVQNPSDKKTYLPVREYNLSNVGYFFQNTAKDSFKFVLNWFLY